MDKYRNAILSIAGDRDMAQHQLDYMIKVSLKAGCNTCPCLKHCSYKPKYVRDCHAKVFNHSWKIAKRRMK